MEGLPQEPRPDLLEGQNDETVIVDTDVFEEQMIVALDKVRRTVEEVGSCMDNIIKTMMLLKNVSDYPKMRRSGLEY